MTYNIVIKRKLVTKRGDGEVFSQRFNIQSNQVGSLPNEGDVQMIDGLRYVVVSVDFVGEWKDQ